MKNNFKVWQILLPYLLWYGIAMGQNNISRLEYYVDADPGFGLATAANISAGTILNNVLLNINTAVLNEGFHRVGVRSKNNNGWGITNHWLFLKQKVVATNINKMEYFLDNIPDPGFGKATDIPVSSGSQVNDVVIPLNISLLTNGIHNFFVRSRDNSGAWSITNRFLFIKSSAPSAQISKLEYFLDNVPAPAFGKAIPVTITPGTTVNNVVIPLDISTLSMGIHSIFVRSQDNNGSWSITNRFMFIKNAAPSSQVTKVEYFVDNIVPPGFGKATAVSITPSSSVNDLVIPVDISSLSLGIHSVSVRSQDNNGSWSLTNRWLFLKESIPAVNVQKAEYFVNTDPGFGKGTAITITPGAVVNDVNVPINASAYPNGINHLYVRTQNSNGAWSLTNHHLFINEKRSGTLTNVEYFYDTDPGFGKGIPIAINPTQLLNSYVVPVNVTGLSLGKHVINLRSKSPRGWSLTNRDTFEVTVTSPVPFINVNSVTDKINCAWNNFRISFHATGTYAAGNHFTVQLSDKDGSFASPITIGDTVTTKSSEVYCVLPLHLPEGTNYHVRVISTNAVVTGINGVDNITIHDRPELGADTTAYIVCSGETVNLIPLYNTGGFTTANWSTANTGNAPAGSYNLIVSNIYGCTDTATAFVKQDANIWTGAISKNWHTAGNWSNGHVPNEKTHAIIKGGTPNACEISDTDGTAASVQVVQSGSIKLTNGKKLFVKAACNPLPTGN